MSHDAWAVGNGHIYNYNETRGLVCAKMSSLGKWEQVIATNRSVLGLKCVSMVLISDRLLLRHSKLTEQPFIMFACDTLEELP